MRIALLCACAEPQRDGVGDYAVRLAEGLIAEGHDACVIAVRDLQTPGAAPVAMKRGDVHVLRLPGRVSDAERGRWLAAELAAFKPDWVVLQFVCWGFADRGVLDPLPAAFLEAVKGWRVALYCHELWLGLERGSSLRHRWWGRQQRASILHFMRSLQPALVLTSNPVYSAVLARHGFRALILPLISNIPVHDGTSREELLELFGQRGGQRPWAARSEVLLLAVFGTVFPAWRPEHALRWLSDEAQRRGRRVLLASIGRPSQKGALLLTKLARRAMPNLSVVTLGETEPRLVSALLREADIGLPSSGWMLLGKSGVSAAMFAHGLPQLIVRHERPFRDAPELRVTHAPGVFRFDAAAPLNYDTLINARRPPRDTLPEVAGQLVSLLREAERA